MDARRRRPFGFLLPYRANRGFKWQITAPALALFVSCVVVLMCPALMCLVRARSCACVCGCDAAAAVTLARVFKWFSPRLSDELTTTVRADTNAPLCAPACAFGEGKVVLRNREIPATQRERGGCNRAEEKTIDCLIVTI